MEQMMTASLLAILLAVIGLYERELRRIARFLGRGDRTANERVEVGFSTPGISSVAAAVNREMEERCEERAAIGEQRRAFRTGLAALSHDIRTPLSGAQGYLQLHDRSSEPGERARCLRGAASCLADMRALTDALLDYAKASSPDGAPELSPVEVMPVLASVLAEAYPRFAERGWEPAIAFADERVQVVADEESLGRVLSNLVANSLQHGASAPVISQGFLPVRDGEGSRIAVISISNEVDDARSIDADRLFERFYRSDSARSGTGSGLGLAIVARLCERMGGSVAARVEGGSLSVSVRLPAA